MASSYDNYQNTLDSNSSSYRDPPPFPLHLCFFLSTLVLFMGLSWYLSYESIIESLVDQLRLLLILSPLLLLLVVYFLSSRDRGAVPFNILSLSLERESFHGAGGSPWGVGMVLVLVLFMISYQGYFQERWFPLLSHRRARS